MASKSNRTEACVLKQTKLRETDVILTLFTKEGGQSSAIAKGLRRPGSKFGARLEPFSHIDVLLYKGRNLDIVQEVQLINSHASIREDLIFSAPANCAAQIIEVLSRQNLENPNVFALLVSYFNYLETLKKDNENLIILLTAGFVFKALAMEGWRPHVSSCLYCGEPLSPQMKFSHIEGGAICLSCAKNISGCVSISDDELNWIQALIMSTFKEILQFQVARELAIKLFKLSHEWSVVQTNSRLKAFEFYCDLIGNL